MLVEVIIQCGAVGLRKPGSIYDESDEKARTLIQNNVVKAFKHKLTTKEEKFTRKTKKA